MVKYSLFKVQELSKYHIERVMKEYDVLKM